MSEQIHHRPEWPAVRIIPCLDVNQGRVVKGKGFVDLKDAGDPVELAQYYESQGADMIVFLDISATHEARPTSELARRVAEKLFIPFTIGGGIRSVEDADALVEAGCESISINSAAIREPRLINEISNAVGSGNTVLAIDAKRCGDHWEVYANGGREATGLDAVSWAQEGASRGAGEILLTSMDRDGTNDGFDLALTRAVADAADVIIIASGGAGKPEHFSEAIREGHADAALAAGIFHRNEVSIGEVREHLLEEGITVRPLPEGLSQVNRFQ